MEHCSLCGSVCIRRVELFCCSVAACRTCAVTKLVSTPTCWNTNCGKPANTFHLVPPNSTCRESLGTLELVAANSSCKDSANTLDLLAVKSSREDSANTVDLVPNKMVKASNPDARTGFVFGGFLKTVIPSKNSSVESSALSTEPSSSSQENSQKEHSLPSLKGKLRQHNKKSVPRYGPTKKSVFTKRLSQNDEAHPSSQVLETREAVLNQVGDPDETFTGAAISNPVGISSKVLPSEESQWNPELLNCDICKEICARAVLVPCCKIQACNGCAVLKVIGGRKCWGCRVPLRSKDLVKYTSLRTAVDMFRKNGNIDANMKAALAEKQTCEDKDRVSSQKIQNGQEILSEPLLEDIKREHGQLASLLKPKDIIAKETNLCSFESTERSKTGKIAESTDEQCCPVPQHNLIQDQLNTLDAVKPNHLKTPDADKPNHLKTPDAVKPNDHKTPAAVKSKHLNTPDAVKPMHLNTPDAVKPKKFSFGWTQSMKKTPFGSPFLKKHGMYSKGSSSTIEGNKISKDKGKNDKHFIEMSRKVILTSPPPNIVERNVCLEYPVAQSTLAGQSITRKRDEDIFSSESTISRYSTRRDSGSSCFSKYGSSLSAEKSASGELSSTSRKSYTEGKKSRNPSEGTGRKSKSPTIANLRSRSPSINIGRKSDITRNIRSPSNDKSRGRSPIRKRSRSPSIQYARSTSPGIHRRWRSRSPNNQCARRSRKPNVGYGRRSRSPDVGHGRRSRSPDVGHGRSRSPDVGHGRRSRSPDVGHGRRTRSPDVGHGRRSRSPGVGHGRRSRSPGAGHGRRSRSPDVGHGRRSRSPDVGHGRISRSPDVGHGRRSRSPDVGHGRRSRSPDVGHGRISRSPGVQYASHRSPGRGRTRSSRSPSVQYVRRSRSPGRGRARSSLSPSVHYIRRKRSPSVYARRSRSSSIGRGRSTSASISFGNRSRSPSITIGSRSRCNLSKRSPSPSIHLRRRSRSSSINCEGRDNILITVHGSSSQRGEHGWRRSRSQSIKRNSKKSRSNNSSNSCKRIRSSSLETLKIRRQSLDRSSSESWTEVQLGRNINFRNDHKQFNNESFKKVSGRNRNPSLVASYSSEDESKNPQKFVDSQEKVETKIEYWEKIKRLKTDQERLWLAKTEFENPVCSDPRTNLTYHGYKRKKVHMLEDEDVDSFYEFYTNPDVVRLKEVKSERRQKFYIKEGKVLPMPGYILKQELRHVKDVVSLEEASREIIDANEFKMLIEKEFYQKFQTTPQNVTSTAHKRYKKPLVAHFKTGQEEAMEFLKFYNSEFNRGQVEEVIYLEKMYKSFGFYYGKMQPLYCKTCKFAHAF